MGVGSIRKGEITKKHIIGQSAILMNQHGFLSTSLSEIVEATGMQKGGLYNHFKDKEELALYAFDHCCSLMNQHINDTIKMMTSAKDRIIGFIEAYFNFSVNPQIPGGCPIMNATVESDGESAKLQEKAQMAMKKLIVFLIDEITNGINNNEIRSEIDPQKTASIIMATVEGGILLNKLFTDRSYITTVQNHLFEYVNKKICINGA